VGHPLRQYARSVLAFYADAGVTALLADAPADQREALPVPQTAPPATPAPLGPAAAKSVAEGLAAGARSLEDLRKAVEGFTDLDIARRARAVFADGAAGAALMVVGEAPGAEEDRAGLPFVGESGRLLDRVLGAAGWSRARDVYITNAVLWRPPGNRTPTEGEVEACRPILLRHIELAAPRVVLACGKVAAAALLGLADPISRLRGRWHAGPGGVPVRVTYHPAYLLRTPAQGKPAAWADALAVLEHLREARPEPGQIQGAPIPAPPRV
jgi:uracil-DNA glycosylase family 4